MLSTSNRFFSPVLAFGISLSVAFSVLIIPVGLMILPTLLLSDSAHAEEEKAKEEKKRYARGEAARHSSNLLTPRFAASATPEMIREAYEGGGIFISRGSNGKSPLMWALNKNHNPEVIREYLNAGSRLSARDNFGYTPLIHAAIATQSPEILFMLLDAGSDAETADKKGKTAWDHALGNPYLRDHPDVGRLKPKGN